MRHVYPAISQTRNPLGIEKEAAFLDMGMRRREELDSRPTAAKYRSKISDIEAMTRAKPLFVSEDDTCLYGDLPF